MQTTVVSTSRRQGKASRPAGQASQQATAGHAAAADSSKDVTSVKDVCGAAANAAANGANGTDKNKAGDIAGKENVMRATQALPTTPIIKGWDPNTGADLDSVLGAMMTSGFQATALGQAIHEVNRMISWRLSDEPVAPGTPADQADPAFRAACKTKIFLGYTSNLISAGTREQIRYLVQHKMVDVIVTTAGGVEEDFIKCMGHTYMGDWTLKGSELRSQALNRIGNMLIPNSNYITFEDWMMPLLDEMLQEQKDKKTVWTPSKMIARMGAAIDNPDSVYYWAWKNNIPVFCPAITDGSIGDMLYFHRCKTPGLVVDLVGDVAAMDEHAINASPRKTGMIILGGGLPKHHINNANLMRNGADFAVYLNTAQEYDGSDSGARPDEAVSWGKISTEAKPVKVTGDATILFPLLLSQTFCKLRDAKDASLSGCQHDVNNATTDGVWSAQQKQMIVG